MAENPNDKVHVFEGNVADRGLHKEEEGLQSGVAGVGVDTPGSHNGQVDSERSNNPARSIRRYYTKKSLKKREEAEHWEELGDEDLSGKRGLCHPKRLFWEGSRDSQGCPTASPAEVKDIFRHIIMDAKEWFLLASDATFVVIEQPLPAENLGAYEEDLAGLTKAIKEHDPLFDPKGVVDLQKPKEPNACPPYFIYVDHKHEEVSMYIRGLNLMHRHDYEALLNNRKGEKKFNEGYVHHGMSGPSEWAVTHAGPVLKNHLVSNSGYRLRIVGHSLGAGVAALLTIFLIEKTEVLGGISPNSIHCIAIAPPRVMSLSLANKYAPYISSVIYQDDFLPRVSTQSVKRLFLTTFALYAFLYIASTGIFIFMFWVKQVFKKAPDDMRRLYPPGKIYHFVYKQPGRPAHRPIRVRVVPSPENRFERLALSASGTIKNHYILALTNHLKTFNWPEELKDQWLTSVLQTA